MLSLYRARPAACLVVGLVVGFLLGALLPHAPAHSSGNDRFGNFALCTARLDDEGDVMYFFDFTAGDLKAAVVNPLNGKFTTFYYRNVVADFGLADVKEPRFLMVSGAFTPRRGGTGNITLAGSTVYVAELSTGTVWAYSVPWNKQLNTRPGAVGPIVALDTLQLRQIVRDNK